MIEHDMRVFRLDFFARTRTEFWSYCGSPEVVGSWMIKVGPNTVFQRRHPIRTGCSFSESMEYFQSTQFMNPSTETEMQLIVEGGDCVIQEVYIEWMRLVPVLNPLPEVSITVLNTQ